ncbi:protocatechuate 3,4-dioxygenase subunit alpha, partial [Nocardioides hankookensis]
MTPTPGQTVGPFFGFALPYDGDSELVPITRPDAIRLHGRVYDGAGDPVPDALIEVWQAAPDGSVPREPGS